MQATLIDITTGGRLDRAEVAGIFRLVLDRPLPADTEPVGPPVALLLVAAELFKAYKAETVTILTLLKRLQPALEDEGDPVRLLYVLDRRYTGWAAVSRPGFVFDLTTGREIDASVALPQSVLESVAYDLHELLNRRLQVAAGKRKSLWDWGGTDAAGHPAHAAEGAGNGDLDQPAGLRDDVSTHLP